MKKPKSTWRLISGIAVTVTTFAVSLLVLNRLFDLGPWTGLPSWVLVATPLGLAWLIAAGVGQGLVPWKKSLAVSTACLLVAAPLLWLEPFRPATGPPKSNVPSWLEGGSGFKVPEGEVGFRFFSSFTYVDSDTSETLNDVLIKLPIPHIGWPHLENENLDPGLMAPQVGDWHIDEYLRKWENAPKYWLYNYKLTLYHEENGLRRAQVYDNSLLKIEVKPDFTEEYHTSGGAQEIRELLGGRTSPPELGCLLNYTGTGGVYPKARVYASDLRPGEGVALEGYFSVPEGLADNVTLSGLPLASKDNTPNELYKGTWRGDNNYGPWIDYKWKHKWKPEVQIQASAISMLQKSEDDAYQTVEGWSGGTTGPWITSPNTAVQLPWNPKLL